MARLTVPLFALAATSPLVVLAACLWAGGAWPWAALLYMLCAAMTLDLLLPLTAPAAPDSEFPAADTLLVILGLLTLIALPAMVLTIAGPSGLSLPARIAAFFAAGLWFAQVTHPAAHELIHRPRPLFSLGLACYTALLFGHHASAHRLVHHRHVASTQDPNTARQGESYYRYLPRAWIGSLRQGYKAERSLRAQANTPGLNPYGLYAAGALGCLALGYLLAGWPGVFVWLAFGLHAGSQILLSDYVQHYGLTRPLGPDGKPAPVSALHSWNAPHLFSSALMLNATRHSDHHTHPSRPYPALHLPPDAPVLPWPLPLAGMAALIPPLWHRRMAPLLARLPQA